MSIEEKRLAWEREQAARVENTDDEILALATDIYDDGKAMAMAREDRGRFWKGAVAGLGFEAWVAGYWGALKSPDRPSAVRRILRSLSDKPYYSRLAAVGLRHPQRRVEPRAEYFRPYLQISSDGQITWGLSPSREREAIFAARYGHLLLSVIDQGEIVAQTPPSTSFNNAGDMSELGLNDDDYRFEIRWRDSVAGFVSGGRWFDMAEIDGVWRVLDFQGRDWDGEWEGSTRTHSGIARIVEPTARERAAALIRSDRIRRENEQHGPVADRHSLTEVDGKVAAANARGDTASERYWRIIQRILEDRAAALEVEDDEAEMADEDHLAEVIRYIAGVRDYPANRAVRGNPAHIAKWNRALATLGVDTGEPPWEPAEIRVRAQKWPSSPWARVAGVLET